MEFTPKQKKKIAQQLKVLDDTAKTYTLKNRAATKWTCQYYLEGTPGCAVGRLIPKKLAKQISGPVCDVFNNLPKHVQNLGENFLTEIQILHDDEKNWSNRGMSKLGREVLKKMKRDTKDGEYLPKELLT